MQTKPPDLLQRLKIETAVAHARIEQAFNIEERTRSLAAYRDVLERLYGFHAVWEPRAEAILANPEFFRQRRKVELLERDLRKLGRTQEAMSKLVLCEPTVPMQTPAEVLGSMYVIEGSTLGGAIIARHVERSLGLGPANGCSYFRCYGNHVGSMWAAFKTALLAHCGPAEEEVVVAAAHRTFEILRAWLIFRAAGPDGSASARYES